MTTKIYKNLIGGKWVSAETGKTFLNHNPANVDDVVGEFQSSGGGGRGSRGAGGPGSLSPLAAGARRLSGGRFFTAPASCCCAVKRSWPGR